MVPKCALLLPLLVVLALLPTPARCQGVQFPSLPHSLIVHAQVNGQNVTNSTTVPVLVYMHDNLTVFWSLNSSFSGQDANYSKVVMKLCYGANSTVERKWRKADPDLAKSKVCKFTIGGQKYHPDGNSTTWKVPMNVPRGNYFVRAFALNSSSTDATPANNAVATGQNTNVNTTTNNVYVEPYMGTTTTLNITIIVLSVSSYLFLFGFFFLERMLKKNK